MSDKEPRRRKKRKDLQPPRKEDVHAPDDHFFTSSKLDAKDSDQELEEEITIPSHQPSVFAKFVFVLLFSGLVVSLSFIFISLHGTNRGDVDIFNDHTEEIEILHDEHVFLEHDDHDHDEHDFQDHDDHGHDAVDPDEDHDEEPEEESLQETFSDYFPSISSILSFNDEHSKEPVEESSNDNFKEEKITEEPMSELPVPSFTEDYVNFDNQDSVENAAEDTDQSTKTPVSPADISEQPASTTAHSDIFHDEVLSEQDSELLTKPDEQDDDEISENVVDYSDSSIYVTETEPPESVTESYSSSVDEDILTTPASEEQEEQLFDLDDTDPDEFIEPPSVNTVEEEEEEVIYYEKESITNDEDFEIREQLDNLDEILQKEFYVDDDNEEEEDDMNDDDNIDSDDEYDDEEGVRDEFDFWQF